MGAASEWGQKAGSCSLSSILEDLNLCQSCIMAFTTVEGLLCLILQEYLDECLNH